MTIRELIDELEYAANSMEDGEDTEVYIGMCQHYGSNFVYNLDMVETEKGIRKFYGDDIDNGLLLIMGNQNGTIKEMDEED